MGCDKYFPENKEVVIQPNSKTSLKCKFCSFNTAVVKPSKARKQLERHKLSLHITPVGDDTAPEHENNSTLAKSHTAVDEDTKDRG